MSRYLLCRVAEDFGATISFEPKLFQLLRGAACHVSFSTDLTTSESGSMGYLEKLIGNLESHHSDHIKLYGEGNDKRLTGKVEASDIRKFTWGIGDRSASVRVPASVASKKKGYF